MFIFRKGLKKAFGVFTRFETVVGKHLVETMEKGFKKGKFKDCQMHFDALLGALDQQQAAVRCKLLFQVECLDQSMSSLRPALQKLVIEGAVDNKGVLDRLVKWATRELKGNSNLSIQHLRAKLETRWQQQHAFQLAMEELRNSSQGGNVTQVCKQFRDKFDMIANDLIFQAVKEVMEFGGERQTNQFWDKIKSIKPRLIAEECNDQNTQKQHERITEGRLRFRFPPQPNGYLHIGHVKSIRLNFQSAKRLKGSCYLRFDDTNPETESEQFMREIEENVKWLGYSPDRVTFASDHFEEMIQLGVQLVKEGYAYVCSSTQLDIQIQRKLKKSNPFRDRPIQQSLKGFPNLEEGETLRLRLNPTANNPTLRDPVVFRRKEGSHPRTGTKFKVYPLYDFAHCICDSLQHIDYSLCSLEFEVRRDLYYKILNMLGMYKPIVWEYSRLNVQGCPLSKRVIKQLVVDNTVEGWGDARLLTLRGLRNRGYTPQSLLSFIDKVNASRTGNENVVQYSLLQRELRKLLINTPYKTTAVLKPKLVQIRQGSHESNESNTVAKIYLDEIAFSAVEEGEAVMLKNIGLTRRRGQHLEKIKQSSMRWVVLVWLHPQQSEEIKITIYDRLFRKDKLNPDSKQEFSYARVQSNTQWSQSEMWHLQRVGFFKVKNREPLELHSCIMMSSRSNLSRAAE